MIYIVFVYFIVNSYDYLIIDIRNILSTKQAFVNRYFRM